jgi:hypothetical protein
LLTFAENRMPRPSAYGRAGLDELENVARQFRRQRRVSGRLAKHDSDEKLTCLRDQIQENAGLCV